MLFFGLSVSAAVKLTVSVVSDIAASADVYGDPDIPDEVFITQKYVHFSEDYSSDRQVRSFVDRPSFTGFAVKNGKLSRDLFFIINPEGIDGDGFYRIECDIVKKEVRATIRIYDVRLLRIVKSGTALDSQKSALVKKLISSGSQLSAADLSPLYAANPGGARLKNIKGCIESLKVKSGIDKIEYLGGGSGRHLFRIFLGGADTESQKVKRGAARGYFCYIDYDAVGGKIDAYFTMVEYSVYIK
ncbi:MAG: hypothetical protein ACRCUT_01610 [Spirochaetota bacterium]